MYHSFLNHLSADGHLGCFHFVAIVNSAVMNIGNERAIEEKEICCMWYYNLKTPTS